jgi:ferritin
MEVIKYLSHQIHEEIEDAEKYTEAAIKYKESFPEISQVLFNLGNEEMGHMDKLHTAVSRFIAEHRAKHGEPPAAMLAVYDYLHEEAIKNARNVRILQEMYRR